MATEDASHSYRTSKLLQVIHFVEDTSDVSTSLSMRLNRVSKGGKTAVREHFRNLAI